MGSFILWLGRAAFWDSRQVGSVREGSCGSSGVGDAPSTTFRVKIHCLLEAGPLAKSGIGLNKDIGMVYATACFLHFS